MVANQGARRLRNCLLSVIPGDVVEAAVRQCETTLSASADTSKEGIAKILDFFKTYGVTKEQIEARIQRRMDSIQPAQVLGLKKIATSLKDGMSNPADWFEMLEPENQTPGAGVEGLKGRIKPQQPPAPPKSPKKEKADTQPAQEAEMPPEGISGGQKMDMDALRKKMTGLDAEQIYCIQEDGVISIKACDSCADPDNCPSVIAWRERNK